VSKGFGADLASAHALNAVIADGGGGVERLVHVTRFDDLSFLGGVRPDAGKAIGLQLHADGKIVVSAWIGVHGLLDFALNAEHALDMVPDLVSQYIGLGKISGRAEAAFEFVIEAEVDVDLLVDGAVKGSGGGLGEATR